MAGIDVTPGVEDRDDRLARIVGLDRAMEATRERCPNETQIVGAVPAMTSQRLGILQRHQILFRGQELNRKKSVKRCIVGARHFETSNARMGAEPAQARWALAAETARPFVLYHSSPHEK